LVIVNEQNEN